MPAWVVRTAKDTRCKELSRELLISPLQAALLCARGIETAGEADRFLHPSFEQLHDPFLFNEMESAVTLLHDGVTSGERILVHGDYDADGVCGTALLYQALSKIGANVHYFIPNRSTDGYGLAMRVLERGLDSGLALVISVDCGSSDHREVSYLADHGVRVIITDHHETEERTPGATAFLNPKLPGESYPFKSLAGAGVAFKLMQGLERKMGMKLGLGNLIDLAAMGTLGDYTPLVDENRVIASLGLEQLKLWRRPGFSALRAESGLPPDGFTAKQVCFTIVPRLNSPGRIGSARKVVELLVTDDESLAPEIAREIEEKNRLRKAQDSQVTEEASYLADVVLRRSMPSALVFSSSSWPEGVVGISAARLAERYNLPAVLIAVKDGVGKGSARSAGMVNIKEVLARCAGYLDMYGGHKEAGGFSIPEEHIPDFQRAFEEAVDDLAMVSDHGRSLFADTELTLEDCSLELVSFIERLAPFGPGNHEPLFLMRGIAIAGGGRIVGREHLKMSARDRYGALHELIAFSLGREWQPVDVEGNALDLLAHLRKNSYMGRTAPQLQVTAIRHARRVSEENGGHDVVG
jgi:single-stranded-DNA-specific exonuclease